MSEKLYGALLRLYSRRFREAYGEEAMQLVRDRIRDERGFAATLRLWFDLLADLAAAVPGSQQTSMSPVPGDAAPSFVILELRRPGGRALLMGGMLSLMTLAAFPASINHFGNGHTARTSLNAPFAFFQPKAPADVELDAAKRQAVVQAIAEKLKERYVSPPLGQKLADALLEHQNRGDYDRLTDGEAFAALITKQLREGSDDMHLEVVYSKQPFPEIVPAPASERAARYRAIMERENCTVEKVEVLPANIGYLKINSFPDLSVCQAAATSAMAKLNGSDAVIFDVRDNRGGYGETVMFLSAYLFDHPAYMFSPRANTTVEFWTHSPVGGSRLVDKPVYLLTSNRTFSAAEYFAYNMKMLRRATLVGETTGGGAHAGAFYRIDGHFGVAIYEVSPINPYSKRDWEGTGVEPDVKVKAADALERALQLARAKRSGK